MTTQRYLYEQGDMLRVPGELLDEEISTDSWPLPAPNPWKPAPTLWERFWVWLIGVTEEE